MKWLCSLVLLAAGLSGCLADADGDPIFSKDYGSDDGPRSPARTDGAVTTEMTVLPTGWMAEQQITIRNDVPKDQLQVFSNTGFADLTVQAWGEQRYELVALLRATSSTEADAREGVASMQLHFGDRIDGRALVLELGLATTDWQPTPLLPGVSLGGSRSATLTLRMPSTDILDVNGGSGDLAISGFSVRKANLDAGSGDIVADLGAEDLRIDTGSGDVELDFRPMGSGELDVDTGSGTAVIRLTTGPSIGYDIEVETGSGDATVEVADTEDVGEQDDDYRRVRTVGYSDRDIQTAVRVDTGSGDATVTG